MSHRFFIKSEGLRCVAFSLVAQWGLERRTHRSPDARSFVRFNFISEHPNFCLRQVADDYAEAFDAETTETVRRNIYFDDLLRSVATEDAAVRFGVGTLFFA